MSEENVVAPGFGSPGPPDPVGSGASSRGSKFDPFRPLLRRLVERGKFTFSNRDEYMDPEAWLHIPFPDDSDDEPEQWVKSISRFAYEFVNETLELREDGFRLTRLSGPDNRMVWFRVIPDDRR